MKRAVAVFAVIICSFFTCITGAEAKGVLPADAAAFCLIWKANLTFWLTTSMVIRPGEKFIRQTINFWGG